MKQLSTRPSFQNFVLRQKKRDERRPDDMDPANSSFEFFETREVGLTFSELKILNSELFCNPSGGETSPRWRRQEGGGGQGEGGLET